MTATVTTDPDRAKAILERLFDLMLPTLAAYVTWEYQVIDATPGPPVVLDLLPTGTGNPFGPLSRLTLWPGPDGGVAVPTPGKLVRVRFANGDPSKPEVCGLDPTDTPSIVYQYGLQVNVGSAAATPLALAIPVTTAFADIETFIAALQTVLAQMVAGYVSLTAPQIAAWTAAASALTASLVAQALATPTVIVKGT
jgi:hypothetical protein